MDVPISTQFKAESAALVWGLTPSDLIQLIATLLALITLIYAAMQLKSAGRTAQAQLILMIDESLHHYEDVRTAINASELSDDEIRLRRYVARFERIGILLQLKQIDLATINKVYGGRIKRLLERRGGQVHKILREGDGKGWQPMIYLWHELYNKRQERKFPQPPTLPENRPVSQHEEK